MLDFLNQLSTGPLWVTLGATLLLVGWYAHKLCADTRSLRAKVDEIHKQVGTHCNLTECPVLRDMTHQLEALVVEQKRLILELIGLVRAFGLRNSGDDRRA